MLGRVESTDEAVDDVFNLQRMYSGYQRDDENRCIKCARLDNHEQYGPEAAMCTLNTRSSRVAFDCPDLVCKKRWERPG